MKRYLLDVNVLVAWGWADHVDHLRVDAWLAGLLGPAFRTDAMMEPSATVLTTPITELGFVRVSLLRARHGVSLAQASRVLAGLLARLGSAHQFLPDDSPVARLPRWVRDAAQTTDGHLAVLAQAHDAQLATCDTGIPGAFLVPQARLV